MLAALNHPLIAHVYGFEQIGDMRAIVMELVEGVTLEERIAQGPIAIPDALHIARQLAEALETAHELGIIHRDLKPANIKLMVRGNSPPRANDGRSDRGLPAIDLDDCTVKVLDFGLAKALDTAAGASGNALNSPTLTARATELGTILGTAAYMAPEQARGKAVDRRADVWAFGVVCYEMLTGSRLFKGEDISDTMAAVLRQPIDFAALPRGTPAAVRTLLERCLERDRGSGCATSARRASRSSASRQAPRPALLRPEPRPPSRRGPRERCCRGSSWHHRGRPSVALGALLGPWARPAPPLPAPVTRVASNIGVPGSLVVDAGPAAVLSPDGRTIVFRVRKDNTRSSSCAASTSWRRPSSQAPRTRSTRSSRLTVLARLLRIRRPQDHPDRGRCRDDAD